MFYHSSREHELTTVFGKTDSYGIHLIAHDHSYPYLVEQEEYCHGALLGNTSHGTLFQLFDSFYLVEATIDKAPGSADFDPKRLKDQCDYIRAQMIDESIEVHEGFAKYIAYCWQVLELGTWPSNLLKLFEEDTRQFSLMEKLVAFLGRPDPGEKQNEFQKATAHLIAKWALNTTDLERLYQVKEITSLKDALFTNNFWGKHTPDRRAFAAVEYLTKNKSLYQARWEETGRKLLDDIIERSLFYAVYHKTLYDELNSAMALSGFETPEIDSIKELSMKSVIISARIQSLTPGLFSQLPGDHVELIYSTKSVEGRISESLFSANYMFAHDPACKVQYDQRFNPANSWQDVKDIKQVAHLIDGINLNRCFLYPVPEEESRTCCLLIVQKHSTSPAVGYLFLRLVIPDWDFISLLKLFNKKSLTVFFLSHARVLSLTNTTFGVKNLADHAQIVFWSPVGLFTDAALSQQSLCFLYITQTMLDRCRKTQKMRRDCPLMLGVFKDDAIHLASVPFYYSDILDRFKSNNKENPLINSVYDSLITRHVHLGNEYISLRGTLVPFSERAKALIAAAADLHAILFEENIIPDYLPVYRPLEMAKKLPNYQ